MEKKDILKLYYIILFIDLYLLLLLYFQAKKLSTFEYIYIISLLLSHIVLILALSKQWFKIIDSLHYFLFFSILISVFIQNILLQTLVLSIIFLIQFLWIVEKRCIMNTNHEKDFFGFSDTLSIITLIYTIILSIKLGFYLPKKIL